MKRSTDKYDGVPYLRYDPIGPPKGAILYLHGIGEKGNDISDTTHSVIENNELPKMCITPGFECPYIVIAPQLASNQGGWYQNTTTPMIQFVQGLSLDIHLTGLSLGAVPLLTIVKDNPSVFKTVGVICGKVDFTDQTSLNALYAELAKVPCVCYYDPTDKTIYDGYDSIVRLYKTLNGKTDISLVTLKGVGSPHAIWSVAYPQYLTWLAAKIASQPVPDVVVSFNLIDGTLVAVTQSGKKVSITPASIQ